MRRRRSFLGVVLAFAALGALPARRAAAVICAVDEVPAATLLLPYFEVDLAEVGVQTLFSINNASAAAVLAHVVIWSDLSVPVLDFNVYLTGYDVQTINLRNIIVHGNLPQTASAGQDPNDTISPQGSKSQDVNFASCNGQLPPPPLPATFITHLQNALTGKASSILSGLCAGQDLGDNIARGYVTVDTVNNCTLRFPGDTGYFAAGGSGDATNQNVLWGDYFIVFDQLGVAGGNPLVHVEASTASPATSTSGRYTFYGRYVGWSAVDNREPLATSFAVRFAAGGPFSAETSYIVWRDAKFNQHPFTCPAVAGTRPCWYPLTQEGIVIFDEQEHPVTQTAPPVSPPPPGTTLIPFPAEAQRTRVGGPALTVPFAFGWMYLDLNTSVACAGPNPPVDPAAAQAFVTSLRDAGGRFTVGIAGVRLDSACAPNHSLP